MSQSSSDTTIRRALVLSGGGARGAYEVGVMKALVESGLHFDLVFGTSIGAINAIFFAQNALERLEELWCVWRPGYVARPSIFQLCHMVLGRRWSLFDPKALEEMLFAELDLNKLHESSTQAGFVVTDLCTLQTRLETTAGINSAQYLVDILMATCALPLVFPPRQLNGQGLWIDGGIVRNTPVLAALKMGAKEIYAVLLHGDNPHSCPVNFVQYLARCIDVALAASAVNGIDLVKQCNFLSEISASCQPVQLEIFRPQRSSQIGLLDFDPALSRLLMKEGYQDTVMKLSGSRMD